MRTSGLAVSLVLCFLSSFAETKTVIANNSTGWNTGANWLPAGVPASGDVVVIPLGKNISVKGTVYATPAFLTIQISGSLDFEPSGKLDLTEASSLQILSGGQITSHNNNSEVIKIGGVTKYQGGTDVSPLVGPAYASSTTGESPTGFISITVLPVHLKSFSAQQHHQQVVVQWSITGEQKLRHFILEKSRDGNQWSPITVVHKKENISEYKAVDHAKNSSLILYRLKITGMDGTFVYSMVLRVQVTEPAHVMVVPNPVSEKIRLFVPEHITTRIHLRLLDLSGQVVKETDTVPMAGKAEMDVHLLRKGIYSIQVVDHGVVISRQKVKII